MIGPETLAALIARHGLAIVAPVAIVEGPIVTVIAAWLASQGLMRLWALAAVVIAADLVGDFAFYTLGRLGLGRVPARWRARTGLTRARLAGLTHHYDRHGGRMLLLGKVTHSAGFAVLAAAGMARMPLARFFWFNLLGTVPKSLFFVALGYGFGAAYASIDGWIIGATLATGGLMLIAAAAWICRTRIGP